VGVAEQLLFSNKLFKPQGEIPDVEKNFSAGCQVSAIRQRQPSAFC